MTTMRDEVEGWLKETGLPYSIERGGKHSTIKVNGVLAGIIPGDGKAKAGDGRARLNIRAQIRRAAKGLKP